MTVYPCGMKVELNTQTGLRGIITAISIRGTDDTYEVAWWDGKERKTAWLSHDEIVSAGTPANMQEIGFHAAVSEDTKRLCS